MQGWILSHLEASPSIPLFLDACRVRGHQAELIHPRDCVLEPCASRPPRAATNKIVPEFVITKLGSTAPGYALGVVRALEAAGVNGVNESASS